MRATKQETMKAAVYRKYGPPDVVTVERIRKPTPRKNEVLIRIYAATVSSADWRIRSLTVPVGFGLIARLVFGIFKPRKAVLGTELSGVVEAVGADVTNFVVGDEVFAYVGAKMGCHAEYRTMDGAGNIARKPANLSFEESAAISFGGTTALYFLRDIAKLRAGDQVLIIGGSGAVGSSAIQLAKYFGAEVTSTCSTGNIERVRSIGADHVIDYTEENFASSDKKYDVIFDTIGVVSFSQCESSLKPDGRLLMAVLGLPQMIAMPWKVRADSKKVMTGEAKERLDDLLFLKSRVEAGEFKPLIDQCYSIEQIVDAHAHVDTGRKRGSVVVTMR